MQLLFLEIVYLVQKAFNRKTSLLTSNLNIELGKKFDKEVEKKVHRYQTICGKIGETLGRKQKEIQRKLYKVMAASES